MSILATMFKFATSRPCKTFLREVHLLTFIKKRRFTVQKATLRARSRISRDWSPKFATWLNMIIGCSSKSIWVIKLSFCQNDSLLGESFLQNNSLVTHILFELQPIIIFSPVANFGDQSLEFNYANSFTTYGTFQQVEVKILLIVQSTPYKLITIIKVLTSTLAPKDYVLYEKTCIPRRLEYKVSFWAQYHYNLDFIRFKSSLLFERQRWARKELCMYNTKTTSLCKWKILPLQKLNVSLSK